MVQISEVTTVRRLIRYFQHGFILAIISVVFTNFITFAFAVSYVISRVVGPVLMYAPFYAVAFALLGGVNQVLVQKIWDIECEQSIGNGMRDGAIFYMFFEIAFLPVSLAIQSFTMWDHWEYFPDTILVILIAAPFYMIIAGGIGERLALFLYVDLEPEMPSDFSEHSYTCTHCGARYYYGEESRSKGVLTCQNCSRDFNINVE